MTQVGGFDERFFLYSEEKDLAVPAVELGLANASLPRGDGRALHGDTYRPDLFDISVRSKLAYSAKHATGMRRLGTGFALMLHLAVRAVLLAASVLRGRRCCFW